MIDTAFIVCGGKGTRLYPLTERKPKAMVDVDGRPMLEHVLIWLRKNDITKVILGVGHMYDQVYDYFGHRKCGVSIKYSIETAPAGTAGAMALAAELLPREFLYANGDMMTDFRLKPLFAFHERNHYAISLGVCPVSDPRAYGVVIVDGETARSFIEKPTDPTSNIINTGIAVVRRNPVLNAINGARSLEREVYPPLAQKGQMGACMLEGSWMDLGTHEALEKVVRGVI